MSKTGTFTRILAIAGAVLAWLPLAAPVFFSTIITARSGRFRIDYLMPAELFPAALLGGVLLVWAAYRAKVHRRLIGWSLGLAFAALVASQGLAVLTGLASGQTRPGGWEWALVLALLGAYTLALLALAIGGVLLLRTVFHSPHLPGDPLNS